MPKRAINESELYEDESELPVELQLSPTEKAQFEEDNKLEEAIVALKGVPGAKLHVHALKPGSNSGVFMDSFGVSDYTNDELMIKLRDEYGGGDFRIEVRTEKGAIKTYKKVSVMKPAVKVEPEKKEDSINPLMAMMQSMQESTQALITQMAMNQKDAEIRAAENNNNMLIKMMEIQNNKPEPKESPFSKPEVLIAMAGGLKDLFAQKDTTKDFMEAMKMGMDMAGGKGDENMLQTAINTFGKPIADMAGAMANKPQAPEPASVVPQTPVENPAALEQPQPQQPETPTENEVVMSQEQQVSAQMMEYEIQKMCTAASRGGDPVFWADMVIETFGEAMTAQYIANEAMYNMLFTVYPNTANYRPWFDEVRKNVISFLADSEQEDRESTNVQDTRGIIAPPNAPATASETTENNSATDGFTQQSPASSNGELPESRTTSIPDTSTEAHQGEDHDVV